MTDINVHSFSSTVRATDSQSLLSPQVMDRIVIEVMRRLQEKEDHDCRLDNDRRLSNSVLDQRRQGKA